MANPHVVRPNIRVVDISQQFQDAVNGLSRDQLVKEDGFTLFEAVSALEIGDPKMDSGSNAFDENAQDEIDVVADLTPDQLVWTIDELVRREVAWLQGYPLAQTLFTSVHLDRLLWPDPKTLDDARFVRPSSGSESPAQAVLRAYCLGLVKCCDLVLSMIASQHYYEEEDFATQLYNREMLRRFSSADVVAEIEKTLVDLESMPWQKELVAAVRKRMTFRVDLLNLLLDNAASPPRQPQSPAEEAGRLLADVEHTVSLGSELRGAFSTKIQRRLASSVPPRPMIAVDVSDALAFMRQLLQDTSAAFELFSVSSPSDLTTACWTLMSRTPQPSVYVRALVQAFLDVNGHVLGAYTHKDVIVDDLDALVCPPDMLLDPANERVESPYDDRFRIAWQFDSFIIKCGPSYLNQLRAFCQNRCRVRRNLCHAMLEWDSIQADAEEIDGNLQALTREQPIPYPPGAAPTYSYPLSSWVYHHKLAQFRLNIQVGFELAVFAPYEHASMYWYLSYITGIHLSHLDRIRHFVSSKTEKRSGVQVTLNLLYRHFSYLKAVETLSSALHRVFLVLQRHGHFAKLETKFAQDELQYELRMRPFQPIQIPDLMTHADMDRFTSLRSLTDEQLLDQAARLSTTSKKVWEEVLKAGWNFHPLQTTAQSSTLQSGSQAPVIQREWTKDIKDSMRACIGTSIAINTLTTVQKEAHKSANSDRGLQNLKISIPPPEDKKLDPEFVNLYNTFLVHTPPLCGDIHIVRQNYSGLYRFATNPASGVGGIGETQVPGWSKYPGDVNVRVYVPPGEEPGERKVWPVHFNFHGGGWAVGDLETDAHICHHICARVPCCVIDIEYRLIPEYPFPIGIMDALSATAHILANHRTFSIDPDNITLGGDSSGATIALILNHLFRDADMAQKIKAVVAATPMISDVHKYPSPDLSPWPSMQQAPYTPLLNWENLKWLDAFKAVSLASTHPGTSHKEQKKDVSWFADAMNAPDFKGLAPLTFIATAELDPLRDEAEAYADKLSAAGNQVVQKRYAGVPHGFMRMDRVLRQGREYVDDVIRYQKTKSGDSAGGEIKEENMQQDTQHDDIPMNDVVL
ncbi:hypothetical protein DV735_g1954, partial [Chaetothyriales sp. CBS 134920]